MQIRFAAQRPSGDHAVAIPIAGPARGALDSFGAAKSGIEAAMIGLPQAPLAGAPGSATNP